MRFFPIVPTHHITTLGSCTGHCMVLAHLVLEDQIYARAYKKLADKGCNILLDNGSCEKRTPLNATKLIKAANILGKVDVVVVPDQMKDNLKLFNDFLRFDVQQFTDKWPSVQFMGVPRTSEEIPIMVNDNRIAMIGLNRDFEVLRNNRAEIVERYKHVFKYFHMLGIYKDPSREVSKLYELGVQDKVLGIDSALPFRIARMGRRFEEIRPFPPYMDEYERVSGPLLAHCNRELIRFDDMCRGLRT